MRKGTAGLRSRIYYSIPVYKREWDVYWFHLLPAALLSLPPSQFVHFFLKKHYSILRLLWERNTQILSLTATSSAPPSAPGSLDCMSAFFTAKMAWENRAFFPPPGFCALLKKWAATCIKRPSIRRYVNTVAIQLLQWHRVALCAGTHAKCIASAHFVGGLGSTVSDSKQACVKIEALTARVRELTKKRAYVVS